MTRTKRMDWNIVGPPDASASCSAFYTHSPSIPMTIQPGREPDHYHPFSRQNDLGPRGAGTPGSHRWWLADRCPEPNPGQLSPAVPSASVKNKGCSHHYLQIKIQKTGLALLVSTSLLPQSSDAKALNLGPQPQRAAAFGVLLKVL